MNKNISSIQYNSLNLPSSINYQNGNMASYVYSAAGGKLSVSYQTGTGNTSTQYCGNIIYDNNNLSQLLIDGGYITFSGTTPQYHYYLQDHLGSNRVVVNESGTAEQVTHYYPFGGIIADLSTGRDIQKYKYNGKELDRMHGLDWYDYGARHFDAAIASWPTMDPLAEKYYSMSPYAYCLGNPVKFVDIGGLRPSEEEAARIADHVCDGNVELIGGWKVSKRHINEVTLTDDDSGFKSAIYERTIDGVTEYVYATAGTDIDSYEDWENNLLQIIGASEQYSISKENAELISAAIGEQELTFVGYSLGGGLAATNAYTTGRSAMTFNAAWVSPLTIAPWNRKDAKIDAYVHVLDELNCVQQYYGVRANGNIHWRHERRAILAHSIKNFYHSRVEMIMQKSKNAQSQYMLNPNNLLFR